MKITRLLLFFALYACGPAYSAIAADYHIQKVSDNVYAALAIPGGKADSNSLIVISDDEAILAGAHFTRDGIRELIVEIRKLTTLPIGHIILTHHHRGYNYLDFDLPLTAEVVSTWQSWQAIKSDFRDFKNPTTVFDKGLTLYRGKMTIILSNTDRGHSEGDLIVYLPNSRLLFASDLVYNDAVGFMGDGHMRDWVADLQVLEELGALIVVPGIGNPTDNDGVVRFRLFLQDFFTEILRHLDKGESLAETKKKFTLPAYSGMPGFSKFFDVNVERAYMDLKK